MIIKFLDCQECPRAAIFLSGSGSNAERLLEDFSRQNEPAWIPVVLVTDKPEKSRAGEIGEKYGIPVLGHDIGEFYRERGLKRVSLADRRGREIREEWTDALRMKLCDYHIDFGILAGFVSLTNITGDFPCLNVHPGDLTVEEDEQRILIGLHTVPIERAILSGFVSLRSSVILARPYTGGGGDMDSGPILGVSEAVEVDFAGASLAELQAASSARPEKRPKGGYGDLLERVAVSNQERLKEKGDWTVFPPVVNDFASGRFATDEHEVLFYLQNGSWQPVKTVIYYSNGRVELLPLLN